MKCQYRMVIDHIKSTVGFALLLFITSCSGNNIQPIDYHAEEVQINTLMLEQEMEWNNVNLEGFMKHYWKSDSLKFIGSKGLSFGWQAALDNYKKSYPDAASMGTLHFTNITTDVLNDSNAYVIGKWELLRATDTLSGHYTLLWKKKNGHWVIVADHSS